MDRAHSLRRLAFLVLLLVAVGGTVSCASGAEAAPRAWIDFPRDGSSGPPGEPVAVICHAYAPKGVADVLLLVNGTELGRGAPEQADASFASVKMEWLPREPGTYTLQVRAYDTAGTASSPDTVTVRVGMEGTPTVAQAQTAVATEVVSTPTAAETPTPAPSPTAMESQPTAVPDTPTPVPPTPTPLPPTATPTPITPTATPYPPVEVTFTVDRDSVNLKECTTLHWSVQHATAVYLDGAGVAGEGSKEVCPKTTTTYQLHVEAPGGNVDRSVTVTVVSPPPDTTPPPVPAPLTPSEDQVVNCASTVTLSWRAVSDPSGVRYYAKLEKQVGSGWQSVRGWGPLDAPGVKGVEVECGLFYRWTVRAEDGAGNISPWAPWRQFSVDLP